MPLQDSLFTVGLLVWIAASCFFSFSVVASGGRKRRLATRPPQPPAFSRPDILAGFGAHVLFRHIDPGRPSIPAGCIFSFEHLALHYVGRELCTLA